jgi:hypothetical protein
MRLYTTTSGATETQPFFAPAKQRNYEIYVNYLPQGGDNGEPLVQILDPGGFVIEID